MKIKRFFAPDMRTAIRKVREAQGADAVILSSRNLEDGVEIISAIDFDQNKVNEMADQRRQPSARASAPYLAWSDGPDFGTGTGAPDAVDNDGPDWTSAISAQSTSPRARNQASAADQNLASARWGTASARVKDDLPAGTGKRKRKLGEAPKKSSSSSERVIE